MGTIYVLHFTRPYRHARHYIGYTDRTDVNIRVQQHLTGSHRASPLVKAALADGIEIVLATSFAGTKTDERRFKNNKNGCMLCPLCQTEYRARKAAQLRARRVIRALRNEPRNEPQNDTNTDQKQTIYHLHHDHASHP